MPATWVWSAGLASTAGTVELTRATSRRLSFRLDGRHEANFTIDGRSAEAAALTELSSDVWVRRNGTALFRGRIAGSTDDVSAGAHSTQIKAASYLSVLDTRHLYEGDAALAHATVDQAQIVWLLISATQGRTGGSLGITQGTSGFAAGVGNTGVTRIRSYVPGDSIGKLVSDLSNCVNGFDVEIDADRKVQVWYPSRGVSAGARLDYGGKITSLRRTMVLGHFANTTHLVGAAGTTQQDRATAGLGSDARGRWEAWINDPSIVLTTTLSERADAVYALLQRPSYGYTCTLRRGAWGGPTDVWLGDTVTLQARSGRLATVATCRVQDVTITLDGNGDEEVAMTLEDLT